MLLCTYKGTNGQSASGKGEMCNVKITASPHLISYVTGASVTLMCMVDPPISSNDNITETYLCQCDGCFANGITDMAIIYIRVPTKQDSSMINCSATINDVLYKTDIPFYLQLIQGMYIIYIHLIFSY